MICLPDPDVAIVERRDSIVRALRGLVAAGNVIEIKKGQYQGGLFSASNIDASVTGTVVQGPMVSAYGDVSTWQGGELSFPSISFPTSGSSGFTGPLPLPRLLAPRQFGGG